MQGLHVGGTGRENLGPGSQLGLLLLLLSAPAAPSLSYLIGAKNQFEIESCFNANMLREEGEHHVVNPKEGDEKQCGFCQSPGKNQSDRFWLYKNHWVRTVSELKMLFPPRK